MRMPTLRSFGEGRTCGEAIDTRTHAIRRGSGHGTSVETRAFFALATMRGIGQKTLFALAEAGRSFSDVMEHGPTGESIDGRPAARHDEPGSGPRWSSFRSDALNRGDELAAMLEQLGVMLLLRGDKRFPQQNPKSTNN
jgi:DNA processing protein